MENRRDPFRSARLIYRAVETPDDDALFQAIQCEPLAFQNSNAAIARPQSRKDAAAIQKVVAEQTLIGVVACLPALSSDPQSKPTPVGVIHLDGPKQQQVQHRYAEIAIDILKEHQGKGYGTEAIKWILHWAFETAGLHKVGIACFEYNDGARRLYERIGFKVEGRLREAYFQFGRFWDDIRLGMLDREWREMYGGVKPDEEAGGK